MEAKIDKCSIYTDRFRRQLVSLSSEQFKSFTERNNYFWHPGTNTFLTDGEKFDVVIGAPTARHWEVRQSCIDDLADGSPTNYYTF